MVYQVNFIILNLKGTFLNEKAFYARGNKGQGPKNNGR